MNFFSIIILSRFAISPLREFSIRANTNSWIIHPTKQFIFIALLCVVNSSLLAQTSLDSLQHLPEVVITERFSDREIRSTTPMQILSEKEIRNLNSLQVSDAVKHFSGVTVKDFGGIGGLKTVSVRSLGANHTAVNYNGITVTDVQTGQTDIGRFSLENVETLSLNSGHSDAIFQPARIFASASVLNIQTIAPTFKSNEKTNGKISLKGGSFGLINPSLYSNVKWNSKLSSSFSGEWMSAHSRYPYMLQYGAEGVDSSSVEKRENTDVENLRLETALFADFSEKTNANIRVYYYQSERGLPGATIYYNTQNFSKQRLWDKTFFTQGHLEHSFSPRWVMQANAKYNRGYLRYLDPTYLGASGEINDIFKQNETYGSLSVLFKAFEKLSFVASSDLSATIMRANRDNFATPTRFTSQSVVAAKWVSNHILATANILYTQTVESVKVGEAADNRQKFSPYISASVKPFNNIDLRFRIFYKNSFRLPTFNDLYYPIIGQRNLLPENADQFNIGITFATVIRDKLPLLKFSADTYRNNIKNKIIAFPAGNLHQWTMMNLGKVKINGVDVTAESAVELSKKIHLYLGTAYTFQQAIDITNSTAPNYKHQIAYTPRHSGSARAALEMPWLNAAYSLIWSGIRYSGNYNSKEFKLNGYTDHSLSVFKKINTRFGNMGLMVEGLNLLNKNYQIVRNYPMPGRSYRATISINF